MLSWCDTSFRSISRKCYDEEKYSAVDLLLVNAFDKNIDVLMNSYARFASA